jgi:putative ABC transport system ATP-binding protein
MEPAVAALASSSKAIFCLKNVLKVREKGGQRFELHVPAFVIQQGEFIALVGESGCGKSTLLDMLALVLRPTQADEFTIRIPKREIAYAVMSLSEATLAQIRKADMGYVLQTGGLLPFLTVKENILLPCRLNGLDDVEEGMQQLVTHLDIAEQLTKKPQFLSGGQRQRVAIARALAHRPSIVLADEPTAAVDKYTARKIRDKFKELTQLLGVTLCMVTHDEGLVADAVDRTFRFEVHPESEHHTYAVCREQGCLDGKDSGQTPPQSAQAPDA